jgi:hypothetical protein
LRRDGGGIRFGGQAAAVTILALASGIMGLTFSLTTAAVLVALAGVGCVVGGVILVRRGERVFQDAIAISRRATMIRGQILAAVVGVAAMLALLVRSEMRSSTPSLPTHLVVGEQGIVRFIVVPPTVAGDDSALWQIAERLRQDAPSQTIQAMFWVDRSVAPTRLPLDDKAMASQVAQVNINPNSGFRELRRNRSR